jgi:hypothetical protein
MIKDKIKFVLKFDKFDFGKCDDAYRNLLCLAKLLDYKCYISDAVYISDNGGVSLYNVTVAFYNNIETYSYLYLFVDKFGKVMIMSAYILVENKIKQLAVGLKDETIYKLMETL